MKQTMPWHCPNWAVCPYIPDFTLHVKRATIGPPAKRHANFAGGPIVAQDCMLAGVKRPWTAEHLLLHYGDKPQGLWQPYMPGQF